MTLRSLPSLLAFVLMVLPAFLVAQTSSSEEERLTKLMQDSAQWYVPKNHISIGFRMLSSGGKVEYGNLGVVPNNLAELPPASDGAVTRIYNNGTVGADALRTAETNEDGSQKSTPGGRYPVYTTTTAEDGTTTTTQTGEEVSYTPGLTRNWKYSSETQLTGDGRIGFSNYSASSNGGTAMKDSGPTGGVEFEFSRVIGKFGKRLEWGFAAGLALNGINNKTSGSVLSTLHAVTDYYSLNGQAAPAAPYNTSTAAIDYTGSDGQVYQQGYETTVPLGAVPVGERETNDAVGGTTVNGVWQVKGAYFLMRFGPSLRAQITERLGLNASLGVAGAYAGSTYSVVESFAVPNVADLTLSTPDPEQSSKSKFLNGFYADLNLEWMATERTGLFGGVSAQQLGEYDQTLNGRTAHIDLGSSVGIRGGISIKF